MARGALAYGIAAGGKSRRMGMDKASLKLENQTFLNLLAAEFQGQGPFMIAVRDRAQGEESGFPYVADKNREIGPIEGIRNLIDWSPCEHIFICACDMPFLKSDLVEYMMEHLEPDYDGCVIEDGERVHPLCGIYKKRTAIIAGQMIDREDYRLMNLLRQCRIQRIDIWQSGFPADYIRNINTKEEYMRCIQAGLRGKKIEN